jgi:hypothetical protein
MHVYMQRLKAGQGSFALALSGDDDTSISDDYLLALEGWKERKDQLHKQQKSISEVNEEAEKVSLLSSLSSRHKEDKNTL